MTTLNSIGLVILGAVAGFLVAMIASSGSFAGVYSQSTQYFGQGLYAGQGNEFAIEADGDVTTSQDITLTKSTFCINFYATSTATLVKMVASSTATIEGTDGVIVTQYGACS